MKPALHLSTNLVEKRNCPHCGKKLDGVARLSSRPRPRDLAVGSHTICMYCRTSLEVMEHGFAFAGIEWFDRLPDHVKQAVIATLGGEPEERYPSLRKRKEGRRP